MRPYQVWDDKLLEQFGIPKPLTSDDFKNLPSPKKIQTLLKEPTLERVKKTVIFQTKDTKNMTKRQKLNLKKKK